jgi:hypothetical protein
MRPRSWRVVPLLLALVGCRRQATGTGPLAGLADSVLAGRRLTCRASSFDSLGVPTFNQGPHPLEFCADTSGDTLAGVLLDRTGRALEVTRQIRAPGRGLEPTFDSLEQRLVRRYGPPIVCREPADAPGNPDHQWNRPGHFVSLQRLGSGWVVWAVSLGQSWCARAVDEPSERL